MKLICYTCEKNIDGRESCKDFVIYCGKILCKKCFKEEE